MRHAISLTAILLLLAGCSPAPVPESPETETLSVAASFYPLAFLAEKIGGDVVTVTQVTPGGVEPHEYEPTPQQLATVEDADVLLVNGLGLDPWSDEMRTETGGAIVLRGTDGAELLPNDPHIWLSPVEMKALTARISETFMMTDPEHAETYRSNAAALTAQFSALDAEYKRGLAGCGLKTIVTSHDAFRYLGRDYGFETLAIAGLSPDEEPSPRRIAEIAALAKEKGIHYIFFETLVSPRLAETVATEIGAEALTLNPIEGLTPEQVAHGDDWFSIMHENLQNLRTALQCP